MCAQEGKGGKMYRRTTGRHTGKAGVETTSTKPTELLQYSSEGNEDSGKSQNNNSNNSNNRDRGRMDTYIRTHVDYNI